MICFVRAVAFEVPVGQNVGRCVVRGRRLEPPVLEFRKVANVVRAHTGVCECIPVELEVHERHGPNRRIDRAEKTDLSWEQLPVHGWLQNRLRSWSKRQAQALYCDILQAQRNRKRRKARVKRIQAQTDKAKTGGKAKRASKPKKTNATKPAAKKKKKAASPSGTTSKPPATLGNPTKTGTPD